MGLPIILWGASGQARVLADFLPALGYRLEALVDRDPDIVSPFPEVPLLRGETEFREWMAGKPTAPSALVAIGGDRGADRLEIQEILRLAGCKIISAIHPHAVVSDSARVGIGSQILAGAIVGPGVEIGSGVIVNTRASVDHECRLDDGVHLAPGVTLCGLVRVGRLTLVGAGTTVLPRIRIGEGCVIGAGSLVTRDIPDQVVAYGHPAAVIRPRVGQ